MELSHLTCKDPLHPRLTGKQETAVIHQFIERLLERGASIGIPSGTGKRGWKGDWKTVATRALRGSLQGVCPYSADRKIGIGESCRICHA